jgi:hypothetical protein
MNAPDALPLPEWLRQFGMLVGGDLSIDDARERLRSYGEALRADFAPSVFTATSARHVARHANPKGFFPRYAEVCATLTEWAKANPAKGKALPGAAMPGPSKPGAGHWHGYIASKLVAGGDRAHLLSLARAYATPEELRGIMRAFYADELRAEEQRTEEVRRDKALAVEAVAKAAAAGMAPPKVARATPPQAAPAPEPVDPHAPGRPLTLPELRARLALFEREAKGSDPPPNAAGRIAMLQERIAELSRPKEATA